MRIGFVQTNPKFGCVKENIERMIHFIERNKKAELLVFPELCTTGYMFRNRKELKKYAEPVPSGASTKAMIRAAKETNTFVVFGIAEYSRGKIYSDAVLVGPNGFIGKNRKIHLFLNEKKIFDKGNLHYMVYRTPKAVLGLGVCFDHMFPEAWRTLALKGAEVFCLPANIVTEYCQKNMEVRSLENGCFSIVANRVGIERGAIFKGKSEIIGTRGEVLARAGTGKEECRIVKVNIGKARDKMVTKTNHLLKDRRPEYYGL